MTDPSLKKSDRLLEPLAGDFFYYLPPSPTVFTLALVNIEPDSLLDYQLCLHLLFERRDRFLIVRMKEGFPSFKTLPEYVDLLNRSGGVISSTTRFRWIEVPSLIVSQKKDRLFFAHCQNSNTTALMPLS